MHQTMSLTIRDSLRQHPWMFSHLTAFPTIAGEAPMVAGLRVLLGPKWPEKKKKQMRILKMWLTSYSPVIFGIKNAVAETSWFPKWDSHSLGEKISTNQKKPNNDQLGFLIQLHLISQLNTGASLTIDNLHRPSWIIINHDWPLSITINHEKLTTIYHDDSLNYRRVPRKKAAPSRVSAERISVCRASRKKREWVHASASWSQDFRYELPSSESKTSPFPTIILGYPLPRGIRMYHLSWIACIFVYRYVFIYLHTYMYVYIKVYIYIYIHALELVVGSSWTFHRYHYTHIMGFDGQSWSINQRLFMVKLMVVYECGSLITIGVFGLIHIHKLPSALPYLDLPYHLPWMRSPPCLWVGYLPVYLEGASPKRVSARHAWRRLLVMHLWGDFVVMDSQNLGPQTWMVYH